ncbi:MAG: single-stranded DNA-binding protein [Bacteroidales bacterium]
MSLNKVILIGNVGKDPEVRYFDNGTAMANFTMATSERGYTLPNGTVVPERTEWHNIVVRRELAAFVDKWIKKGAGVYVEGKIRTRTYDDQAGIKRYVTEIYADRIEFFKFGRREEGQTADNNHPSGATPPATPQAEHPASHTPTVPPITPDSGEPDDLPF